LPPKDWSSYFAPLQERLAAFRRQHSGNHDAQALADGLQREIDVGNECGDSYGYAFFLARKT
jgi:hypothetical protein